MAVLSFYERFIASQNTIDHIRWQKRDVTGQQRILDPENHPAIALAQKFVSTIYELHPGKATILRIIRLLALVTDSSIVDLVCRHVKVVDSLRRIDYILIHRKDEVVRFLITQTGLIIHSIRTEMGKLGVVQRVGHMCRCLHIGNDLNEALETIVHNFLKLLCRKRTRSPNDWV